MLTDKEFRALVARHELDARSAPTRFAWVTALWAAAGLAALGLLLTAALLGALWLGLAVQGWWGLRLVLVAGCLSLAWAVLRAIWVRPPPLVGDVITRTEAPRLFELIDRVAARCRAPRPDLVVLDDALNAGVSLRPRLGVLGWHRHVLHLGLPLLMGCDVKALAAILAHEFGHLRGSHHWFDGWLYRTRRSWVELARLHDGRDNLSHLVVSVFFHYYLPRFDARALVLSRQMEVAADQLAHVAVGPTHLARALTTLEIQARYLQQTFWPAVWAQADQRPSPEGLRPLQTLGRRLRTATGHPQAARWLQQAWKALPDPQDTHPGLRDRLELAGQPLQLPEPPAQTAAEALLAEHTTPLTDRLDRWWQGRVSQDWQAHYRTRQSRQQQWTQLSQRLAQGEATADEALHHARLTDELRPPAEALAAWQVVWQRHGQPPEAGLHWAQAVLDQAPHSPDADQVDAIHTACARLAELAAATTPPGQPHWCLPAAQRLRDWLEQLQARQPEAITDPQAVSIWRQRVRELQSRREAALDVLGQFEGPQRLEAAQVHACVLREALHDFRSEPGVGAVYLWRKTDPRAPGWVMHLVVIERSGTWLQAAKDSWWAHWLDRLQLPFDFMVLDLAHPAWRQTDRRDLVALFTGTPEACIYRRRHA
ncbi:M48 family metalloprotease [Ideonella livida]|uniref:M48 family metalloprotease n=1 Tax=Ideonella livida TaxID=2707176 RepID=A0A7C9TK34_9BURK|nr:M48 family metalloprotease [Ideonella livida]NDY90647.1 M48 family metalloprotease [Ideonella livida]